MLRRNQALRTMHLSPSAFAFFNQNNNHRQRGDDHLKTQIQWGRTAARFLLCLIGTRLVVFLVLFGCILILFGIMLHFGTTSIFIGIAFLAIGVVVGWLVRNQWLKYGQELAEIRRKEPWITTAAIAVLIACLPILIALYALSPPSSPFSQAEYIILFGVIVLAVIGWEIRERRKQR